jgi:hypothetical protein
MGNASDGKPKWDLNSYNEAHFDRMRSRAETLLAANIYAIVSLFSGDELGAFRSSTDGYPLTGSNNVNGIDDGYTGGQSGINSMNMTAPNAITGVQDAFVKKMVDALNDLPNVIWRIDEEGPTGCSWWHEHMIDLIHTYEATKPYQHPVGLGGWEGGGTASDSWLFQSGADWVSPSTVSVTSTNYGKVDVHDNDLNGGGGLGSSSGDRRYIWQTLTDGGHPMNMDAYLSYDATWNPCGAASNGICTTLAAGWDDFRNQLGYALRYAMKLHNLEAMTPQPAKASTAHALVNADPTGGEYLVYAPNGGSFSVDLSSASRQLSVEWFNPVTGTISRASPIMGGSSAQSFSTPWGGADAILYLYDPIGDARAPLAPSN